MLEDLEPEEDAPEGSRDSIDLDGRTEAESPFVPLQVDTTPFALDFGLGKGKGKEQEVAKPHRLASFATVSENSLTSQVQHKTPTPQVWRGDYFSVRTPTTDTPGSPGPFAIGPFTPAPPLAAVSRSVPMPGSPTERRPSMYKHASRSMVDVLASFGEAEAGKGKVAEWKGEAPAYDGLRHGGTVKRRRSMPEMMAAPPPYTLPLGNSHPLAQTQVVPRDDEGRETLPVYSNAILLRGEMPRKMEFSAPGVQARDRKWRRVLCELEGTAFRVYRVPKEGWWERRVGAGDVAATEEASIAAAGSGSVAEEVGEENEHGITEVVVPSRSSTSSVRSSPSAAPPQQGSPTSSEGSPTMSRPRLNLGFTLLKPRSHGRSKSDLPNPPRSPIMSRSSLSIPRPSFNSESLSPVSAAGHTSGSSLAPSRSNASLSSARSGLLSSRAPVPGSSLKGKGKAGTDIPEPDPADLIRSYTLQHAESGLGNDYVKRKHVIRVRLEGEQFLLQARDVGDVVEWIEGLHSATDIALDLDERVMPKGPMFPR
ncbi:hypothetical protein FB45DRAFT_743932 [Roridomyces roridus]|uniref:PH domain-containing protein n=1 Tax=Roridomyces roridus TaxID=1738132 RepID=A0AAD7BZP6_9AGAR|nr:hypothetical protein FB45DRAFT_743932 [Roridomyces roridus]